MTIVNSLDETMRGVYIITTQGSRHLWDLNNRTYIRNPQTVGEDIKEMMNGLGGMNGKTMPLDNVTIWPKVNGYFFVSLPYPHNFHQSSTIKKIERIS